MFFSLFAFKIVKKQKKDVFLYIYPFGGGTGGTRFFYHYKPLYYINLYRYLQVEQRWNRGGTEKKYI